MIDVLLIVIGVYFAIGVVFAVVVAAGPIKSFDSVVADSPLRFRFIATPGMAALWPIMAGKLVGAKNTSREP
ncbi:MAG: hypothetical protein ED559_08410 [Phycisphaera sp.]|nr:MAG: hypothetical protein ED559_08410 [Phycisphaera sp.]